MSQVQENRVFSFCTLASLIAHVLLFFFIQSHSLWFYSPVQKAVPDMHRTIAHDQILQESFRPIHGSEKPPSAKPQAERILSVLQLTAMTLEKISEPSRFLFPMESISLSDTPLEALLPKHILLDLPRETTLPDFLSKHSLPSLEPWLKTTSDLTKLSLQSESSKPQVLNTPAPLIEESLLDAISCLPEHPPYAPNEDTASPKPVTLVPLPTLPPFFSLAELNTVNLSDGFQAELTFLPKPEGSGYLFALTLLPREDLQLPKIRQCITFLIDRSNSIQQDRFAITKQAVLRALEEFDEEDSFNLMVFDGKAEKLFPSFSQATPAAIAKAEAFLDNMKLGSFFSTSDPYRALLQTIPSRVQDDEVHTAILLTDGETLSNKTMSHALSRDWTLQNQGKVSLYVIGLDTDPHLSVLETVATLNRGRLIPSTSGRGLKRQVLKLTKQIKTPLAKDLSQNIVCRGSEKMTLYPQSNLAPHLYLGQPYVILGSTDTLDDFILFVQGRLKDQWLNIKKTISFVNAKKGTHSLKTSFHQYEHLDRSIQ